MSTKTDALNDLNILSRAVYGVDFGQPLPARRPARRPAPASLFVPAPARRIAVGDTVTFTNNGESTRGVVTKVNTKTYSIATTEARGRHPVGSVWKAGFSLVTLDTSAEATTAVPSNPRVTRIDVLPVGTRVRFGRRQGLQYTGTIVKVNAKSYGIRADRPVGGGMRVSYDVRCSHSLATAI